MSNLDFGDLHYLGQAVRAAIRHRDVGYLRGAMWVIRTSYERGTHERFTLADYREMRRRRRPE